MHAVRAGGQDNFAKAEFVPPVKEKIMDETKEMKDRQVFLPIHSHREEIIHAIQKNQVTIVVGETGSGKTTQLPQYLYRASFSENGVIGITEPRRIAATSVAEFVAKQLGTELGDAVGYQIRFDDRTDYSTKIKFMTDGILLREFQVDPNLSHYSVIMVDEAHERSANIDFTLGLLKGLLTRRADLKVMVASATIDAEKFSRYFNNAPIIEVSGRTYPVEIVWSDHGHNWDMVETIIEKIIEIHRTMPLGDILVFMTGADDINQVVSILEEREDLRDLIVLQAHGGISPEKQKLIFDNFPGKRKVVVATNIAETSITIDGVVYVVDSGLIKQTHFHPGSGIQSLDVVKHSQAGCNQRAGRAGRTRPGKCFRMFTEEDFGERPQYTEPEIRRMGLAGVVLAMKMIGVKDIEKFNFIDSPDRKAFHEAYETLIALGAITDKNNGLTDLGREMANLPLEPRIARMVLEAEKYRCVQEIATIAAFLSVRTIFVRPKDKEFEADAVHRFFYVSRSDALTFLRVWSEYERFGFDNGWCLRNFLHSRSLWEVKNIRSQLLELLSHRGEITSSTDDDAILRSVAAGFIQNLLEHRSRRAYSAQFRDLSSVFIHPGSAVSKGFSNPRWIVASTIVETSKQFARGVSGVRAEWLPDLAPNHFKFGPVKLDSYDSEKGIVFAKQPIIECGEESVIDYREIQISVSEAWQIQQERIKEAIANGLVAAVFREVKGFYVTNMVGFVGDRQYRLGFSPTVYPQAGVTYYCTIKKPVAVYGTVYGNENKLEADPQFRVLDLPQPESETTKKQSVLISSIAKLLRRSWGAA